MGGNSSTQSAPSGGLAGLSQQSSAIGTAMALDSVKKSSSVSQSLQCVTNALNSLPTDQQAAFGAAYNQCVAPTQQTVAAPAPLAAPPLGTSSYAAEGVPYPIVGTHPTWVMVVSIFAIIGALVLVKK
jgi:hypothetical protein